MPTDALPQHPNLVLIITDQERAPMHWPEGFADARLPTRRRLLEHGISFENATCNTCMCSPSRASFFTGTMPAQHRVTDTLTYGGTFSPGETVLDPNRPNLATMLRDGGYDVHYRGKWHLCKSEAGTEEVTPEQVAAYGFEGWIGPDAGGDTRPSSFGAGRADHDARYIEQSLQLLDELASTPRERPFALVISLINPHDVLAYPNGAWTDDFTEQDIAGDIPLPETISEDLQANRKPAAHATLKFIADFALGPITTDDERAGYVNFYANLSERIDAQIAPIVDRFYAADGTPTQLGHDTVLVRISDHGELALSHGGMRQKAFNVYEETLRVPLIVSNPHLCPQPRTTEHPASLLDLLPTIATLCGVEPPDGLRGADLTPIIEDPEHGPVQDHVLFTFDDTRAAAASVKEPIAAANRIRAIRERRFKYARYFHAEGAFPEEREMYDLEADPLELENLAHPEHPRYAEPDVVAERERLAAKLADAEARNARPLAA
jgi:arylsulfatase A-like enzyme